MTRTAPIIVGGCHRSGTSLVRRVLNAHSAIHCGPEVKFFRDFFGDYPDDTLKPFRFLATARAILPEDDLLDIAGAAFVAIHEHAARLAGKRRWADKAPENVVYLAEWQRMLGDDWMFVHLVRHPLDTLASIKEVGFPRTIPADLPGRIALYSRYTQAGLDFASRWPARYCRVIYEDFVSQPEQGIALLMARLGEEAEPGQLTFNDSPQQEGLEDPKVGRTTRVHAESVRRWRDVLAPDEAQAVWNGTRELWQRVNPTAAAVSPFDND